MNSFITYSQNSEELIRRWRAEVVRDEGRKRAPQRDAGRSRAHNPLAREEAIQEDDSHGD